jgi:hypothetical protein
MKGIEMPRKENEGVEVVVDETVADVEETAKPKKAKKEPARGELPEDFVTPVGFAKILGEKGLQKARSGEVLTEVKPQMVYSYMNNAPKDDPFPIETVTDSIGKERQAVNIEKGVEWWTRKNERTSAKRANAAQKREAKAAREAAKAAEAEAEGEATEAE